MITKNALKKIAIREAKDRFAFTFGAPLIENMGLLLSLEEANEGAELWANDGQLIKVNYKDSHAYCSLCGARVTMIGDIYCPECGKPLAWDEVCLDEEDYMLQEWDREIPESPYTSGIACGKPYTKGHGSARIDGELITDLKYDEAAAAIGWIQENIRARKTPLLDRTSYGIKHVLERAIGLYLTNNQFKDAMLMCGFYPVDNRDLNWCYCISKKSPAFKQDKGRRW